MIDLDACSVEATIEILTEELPFSLGVEAYTVDMPCKDERSLQVMLGMGSCHCCDYIFLHAEGLVLIEDGNLGAAKKRLEKNAGRVGR